MVRTGDVVVEKYSINGIEKRTLIIYDDMGDDSAECYALPLDEMSEPCHPLLFSKQDLVHI